MKNKATSGHGENVKIQVFNLDGSLKDEIFLCNELKDCWHNAIRDAMKGLVSDLEIKYLAWGSSNTANSPSQTTLVAEFGRKQVTAQEDGDTGELVTTVYISPSEATGATIEELGWFAGASTSGSADSGILVARVLYSRAKTNLESIQVERTDTHAEVV